MIMTKFSTVLHAALLSAAALTAWAGEKEPNPAAPPFLKPGDKIAVISPGSTPSESAVSKGMEVLRNWGLVPVAGEHVTACYHLWAGTVDERKSDLLWALRDPSVKAIMCTRGGYGSSQLLHEIPVDTLKKYNKWMIGYSDITALHSAWTRTGHMSIHANMCGRLSETGGQDSLSLVLHDLLLGRLPSYTVKGHPCNHPGQARGILIGGNMSVMVNMSGSKTWDFLDRDYLANRDVVLFFEDVSENISRVSSMLYQLKLKGALDRVRGIIVGHFTGYEPSAGYSDMYEMLHEFLQGYDIPICYDFPTSHDEALNYPLVEGCPVTLSVTKERVSLDFNMSR